MLSPSGEQITNEYDCPLLLLSHSIFMAKTSVLLKAVSIVHECTESYKFGNNEIPHSVGRKQICSTSRLELEHNFSLLYVKSNVFKQSYLTKYPK